MADDWLDQALLSLTGTTDIKVAAACMADSELGDPAHRRSVFEIAIRHNVMPLIRELSHGPSGAVGSAAGAYVISLNRNENEARRRFTLAHEIGHIVISQASGRQLHETTGRRAERFLDEFASRLLLPDYLIDDWMSSTSNYVSIKSLEAATKELMVSMLVLVKRLGQTQLLDRAARGIIVGTIARSRKGGASPALRVHQVATPSWGFIPLNRRFVSIGLHGSAELFEIARAKNGSTGVVDGSARLSVKMPPSYKWSILEACLEQKVYRVRTKGDHFMLIVVEWPRPGAGPTD